MKMRKHHYELIAKAMRNVRPKTGEFILYPDQWCRDCFALATALAAQDPSFNRQLFLRECGV